MNIYFPADAKAKRRHFPKQTPSSSRGRDCLWSTLRRWRCCLAIAFGLALTFAASGATAILENFNDGTLDPALQDAGSGFTISGGVIRRISAINGDDRKYIRTVASDFNIGDWTYEVSFIENFSGQIFFVGLGEGVPGSALANEPRNSVNLRIHSLTYGGGGRVDVAVANPGDAGGFSYSQTIGYLNRPGTFHVKIQKAGNQVTFSILDAASGTISGSVNIASQAPFLDGTKSRLFFGSSYPSAAFDDLSIVRATSAPPPPPNTPVSLPSNAISWWKAENNAYDSIDGNNGSLFNGAGFTAGLVGQALNLNGYNQRVTVPNAANFQFGTSTDFTIEGWIKLNSSQGNYAGIFANWSNPDERGYQLVIVNNRLAAEIYSKPNFAGVGNGLQGTTDLNNGAWHHVAMVLTRSNQNAKLYVDGNIEANVTHTVVDDNLSNPAPIYIGSERFGIPGNNPFFSGNIDELTLYAGALSPAEIQAIYNAGSAGKGTPPPPPPPPSTSPAPLPSNAISWWKAENNFNDSVDGNNGSPFNGAGFSAGLVGEALSLNGSNQRVTVPNAANFQFGTSTDFTIEGWIKLNGSQGNYAGVFANWSNPDSRGYQLVIVNNRLAAEISSAPNAAGVGNGLQGSTDLNNGAWHHVAMVLTRSSQNAKLYVDGKVEANVTHTVVDDNLSNPAPIYIGSERFGNPGSNPFFGGNIDELTLYAKALSPSEIQAIYNAGSAGKGASTPSNVAPVFAGATTTLNVAVNSGPTDVKDLLHASDPDSGQTLTWSESAAPIYGSLNIAGATATSPGTDIAPAGTVTYTPVSGFVGTDVFDVQVTDGTATATRTITVKIQNAAPTFVGGLGFANMTVKVNSGATNVKALLHARDLDSGQILTWTQVRSPQNGALNILGATAASGSADITPGGTITYTPNPGHVGADTFDIKVSDGIGEAFRSIFVEIQNITPTFVGATSTFSVNASSGPRDIKDLLHASDSDNGQSLTWRQGSAPSHGALTISGTTAGSGAADITPSGTITYTPLPGYVGNDSFTVEVTDGAATSARTITVIVLNTPPVFVGSTSPVLVQFNSGPTDIKSLLRVSDSDSGQTLNWSQSTQPLHGTLGFSAANASSGGADITPGGTITYTPNANYFGPDSFAIQVSDGIDTAAPRIITVDVSPASVSQTGDMTSPRWSHSATLLANGKVLVVGGTTISASTDLYDVASGTFTIAGDTIRFRKGDHTATLLLNGKVLVLGGGTFLSQHSETAELYDPNAGTFTLSENMSVARGSHTATLLPNGKVLVAGGKSSASSQSLSSAELYDPQTGTFAATGSMSVQRESHTATLLPDGKVLMTGGGNASAEVYDPSTGTFSATGNMSVLRMSHTATLLANGKVLVTGGHRPFENAVLNTAELYDPNTGTFSATGSLVDGRTRHTATLLPDGKVLLAAGVGFVGSEARTLATVELYDPNVGAFSRAVSLAFARSQHTATLLTNGKVLLAGGTAPDQQSGSPSLSAELYEVAPATPITPVLSGLTPKDRTSGTGGLTLAIHGAAFVPGMVVNWNGSPRTTTFHDNALLSAQIPASDITPTADMIVRFITVQQPAGGVSGPLPFTIKGTKVAAVQTTVVPPGQTADAQTLPVSSSKPGVSATFENRSPGTATDTLSVATYSSSPSAGIAFDTGGGWVDLQLTGADSSDKVTAKFYYPATTPPWLRLLLVLRFGNKNGGWTAVKASGGADPVNDITNNLFKVDFDNTSTPKVTELNGTIFVMSIAPTVVNAIADQSGTYGSAFNYVVPANTFSGENPDQTSSYVAAGLPPGIQFHPATRMLSGVPTSAGTFSASITATENGLLEPLSATASFTFTVVKAPLVIAAENKTKAYASPLPAFTATASGFVNGDTAAGLSALPTLSTTATAASNVGAYAIVATGATAANYAISFVPGTLTITPVPLAVAANDAARNYGEQNPPLTGTLTGVVNNEITATYSTAATPTSPVGTYAIVPSLFDLNSKLGNYTVTKINGTLTVRNVPPVVNAGPDQEKVAGDEVSFAGSFTDPSSPSHTIEWDFGDGSAKVTGTLTPKHAYQKHGSYTVTLAVTDSHGAASSDTLVVTVISAYGLVQKAGAGLSAFVAESKDLTKVAGWINQVLASKTWLDEMHLDAKEGHKVFSDLKSAVQDLQDATKKGGFSAGAQKAAQQAVADLVTASLLLAETLYLENQGLIAANPKDQKQADQFIAQAKAALDAANAEAAAGKYDNAIQNYRESWEKTQAALKSAGK